jgi:hypothetical protein
MTELLLLLLLLCAPVTGCFLFLLFRKGVAKSLVKLRSTREETKHFMELHVQCFHFMSLGQLLVVWIVSAIRVGAESSCNRQWGCETLAFTAWNISCRVRRF